MNHHGAGLRTLTGNPELSRALVRDFRSAELGHADRVLLEYVVKLTRTPGAMTERDVTGLKQAGFDDEAVLDICQIAAYFNYVNRLADGTGVELEEYWTSDEMSITPEEFAARKAARHREL